MCVCVCVYICMYVCIYMYVHMYVCLCDGRKFKTSVIGVTYCHLNTRADKTSYKEKYINGFLYGIELVSEHLLGPLHS